MASGTKLPFDWPTGSMRDNIRQMLEEELTLSATLADGVLALQLKLGDKPIGECHHIAIDENWYTDHGHGGGTWLNGVDLKIV